LRIPSKVSLSFEENYLTDNKTAQTRLQ